ncbi:hypothetical protein BC830DRAFT_1099215 [Chytriomyces sp. MP71]|nr:hypothetical protein BC830DRAFT_1099215 [Chytriomyces sp. MP71]
MRVLALMHVGIWLPCFLVETSVKYLHLSGRFLSEVPSAEASAKQGHVHTPRIHVTCSLVRSLDSRQVSRGVPSATVFMDGTRQSCRLRVR